MLQNFFKVGTHCIVHDIESHLFGKTVKVCGYSENNEFYLVSLLSSKANTIKFPIKCCFLTRLIVGDELKKLQEENLRQIIDLALEMGDKRWFNSLVKKLEKLEVN